jgi:hypothetical protein
MMDFLTAYRAAVEIRRIGDEDVSPDTPGPGGATAMRRGLVDGRGSRAATTVMLMTAPFATVAAGIAREARCDGCSTRECTRAGRMTDTAIVTAAKAAPTKPSARRGMRDS